MTEHDMVLALVALAETDALSAAEVGAWIDAELMSCEEPPFWLIDASLATPLEQKLHHLRAAIGVSPRELEPLLYLLAAISAFERGRLSSKTLARLALHVSWDHELPADVSSTLYDLYEAALCAHDFDGIPQPDRVRAAVAEFAASLSRHGGSLSSVLLHVSRQAAAAMQP